MRMQRIVGVLTFVLCAGSGLEAQNVAGKYAVEFPYQMRRGGGLEQAEQKAQATLTLVLKGDSVVATWQVTGGGIPASPGREGRGTVQGNTAKFDILSQARVNINGNETPVEMISTYTATVEGDEIKGTIESRSVDGSVQAPVRNFSGKRSS
jgi:hypothetical protein